MSSLPLESPVVIGVAVAAVVVGAGSYYFFRSSSSTSTSMGGGASSSSKPKDDANEAEKYPAGSMSIYFGSQTGTAEGFARILMEEGRASGFNAKTVDMEDFDETALKKTKLAIFLMATYGEGEPTDNAARFFRWMKNEEGTTEDNCLANVNFAVFGLGNKQYEHYNRMGKLTNQGIEALGGKRVFEYGEGDDDGTLEEDFDAWKAKLWPSLINQFHPNAAAADRQRSNSISDIPKKPTLTFITKTVASGTSSSSNAGAGMIRTNQQNSSTKHFFTSPHARIAVNRELRSQTSKGDVGSTRHIEIELAGTGIKYETADNLAVLPENDTASVTALAKVLGYDLNETFTVEPADPANASSFKYSFPVPCTVREALTQYFDIHGVPRHGTLLQLVPYITDPAQLAWLMSLLSKENRPKFKSTVEDGGKSLYDLIVNELSSCKIPLQDFLHIAPYMQPRYYTISSSSSCFPDTVHITVSVTDYVLPSGKRFRGLCSSYLQRLGAGNAAAKCRIFVRASTFRLPRSLSTPIVLIGPGTGIAPMRALLQERSYQGKHKGVKKGEPIAGSNTLYFGCKNREVDFLYSDELAEFEKRGELTKLHLAFSRDQKQKVYVQHLISDPANAKALMQDLNAGGYIFVCGATAMGTDVHEAIVSVVMKEKKVSKSAAQDFVKNLQQQNRYVQELWST